MKKTFSLICFVILFSAAFVSSVSGQNALTESEKSLGFELLFDGKTLSPEIWQGNIEGYPTDKGFFYCNKGGQLMTKKKYSNFIFRFEFRMPVGQNGNNGVGIRTRLGVDPAYEGMEIQILNDDYKNAQAWQKHGSIYGVVPAVPNAQKPAGEWNTEEIIAFGPKIKVTVNNKVIVDADITDAKPIHSAKHPGLHNETGLIGFLGHGDPVAFRNIRILSIKNKEDLQKAEAAH